MLPVPRRLAALVLVCIACALGTRASAQSPNLVAPPERLPGLLRVLVTDTARRPLEWAQVLIASVKPIGAVTDAKGIATLAAVPRGTQRLTVRRIGYKKIDTTIAVDSARGTSLSVVMAMDVISLEPITCCGGENITRPVAQPRDTTPPPPPLPPMYGWTARVRTTGADSIPARASFLITNEQTNEERRQEPQLNMVWLRTGLVNFGGLRAGNYRFIFEAPGFRPETLSHVKMPVHADELPEIVRLTRDANWPPAACDRSTPSGAPVPFCALDTPAELDTTGLRLRMPASFAQRRTPAYARVSFVLDSTGRVMYGAVQPVEVERPNIGAARKVLEYTLEQLVLESHFKPGRVGGRAVATRVELELRLTWSALGPALPVVRVERRPWGMLLVVGEEYQATKPPR